MNFLSSYARKIATGKQILSDKLKYSIMIFSIAIVHTALFFLFLSMQVYPMVVFNILSVFTYLICGHLVHHGIYFPVYIISYLEIILHSFVATLFIGWQFGFPLYIIALVPCSFYVLYTFNSKHRRIFLSSLMALISFISFVGCRILSAYIPPVYVSSSEALEVIVYNFNTVCTYIFIIFFSLSFVLEMQNFTRKLEEKNTQLEELANIDPLTRLFNRRCADKYMKELVEKNDSFHVMMCDIDDFKKLNDTYGHEFGDIVLKGVSSIVQDEIAEYGYAFRWGGEEILVLCDSPDAEKAHMVAENIRKTLEAYTFDYSGEPVHCTLTIGVFRHISGEDIDKTISKADKNLYIGKDRGKNVVIM